MGYCHPPAYLPVSLFPPPELPIWVQTGSVPPLFQVFPSTRSQVQALAELSSPHGLILSCVFQELLLSFSSQITPQGLQRAQPVGTPPCLCAPAVAARSWNASP
jgi:hypothetical protein